MDIFNSFNPGGGVVQIQCAEFNPPPTPQIIFVLYYPFGDKVLHCSRGRVNFFDSD